MQADQASVKRHRRRTFSLLIGLLTVIGLTITLMPAASAQSGPQASYSNTDTIPIPPASSYRGSGGGDGWDIALDGERVYNVFHHQSDLVIACHSQADGSTCGNHVIRESSGGGFYGSSHPSLHYNAATKKAWTITTRRSDGSVGAVCISLSEPGKPTFCGYSVLTASASGDPDPAWYGVSNSTQVGNRLYSFNYVRNTAPRSEGANSLVCFDVNVELPCTGSPFTPNFDGKPLSYLDYTIPPISSIDNKVLYRYSSQDYNVLDCFSPASGSRCGGVWPVTLAVRLGDSGTPYPTLSRTGQADGLCMPGEASQCFRLDGTRLDGPQAQSTSVLRKNSIWNGPTTQLGTRIYQPNGNSDQVECWDFATGAVCAGFPLAPSGLGLIYTVNRDPNRATCLWINSDYGPAQIQNFDAYTGGPCAAGNSTRFDVGRFFENRSQECMPSQYRRLAINKPTLPEGVNASISGYRPGGAEVPSLSRKSIGGDNSFDLSGMRIGELGGELPHFVIEFEPAVPAEAMELTLSWSGADLEQCRGSGTTVTDQSCKSAYFLAVPGSGEQKVSVNNWSEKSRSMWNLRRGIDAALDSRGIDRSKVGSIVVNYPAKPVSDMLPTFDWRSDLSLDGFSNLLGGNIQKYLAGKDDGVHRLNQEISALVRRCGNVPILLGGYSQGAAVVHDWLNGNVVGASKEKNANIAAVGLVADPERVARSRVANSGSASSNGVGACGVFAKLVDCTLTGRVDDVKTLQGGRLAQVCDREDIVCDTSESLNRLWESYRYITQPADSLRFVPPGFGGQLWRWGAIGAASPAIADALKSQAGTMVLTHTLYGASLNAKNVGFNMGWKVPK